MSGRDQILADALRLEDKELEARKDLWLIGRVMDGDGYSVMVVEAVTGPGAVGVALTLDLLTDIDPGDLVLHGPHSREKWPEAYWYRWLTEADVARMEEEIGS